MEYQAPVEEMLFLMTRVGGLERIARLPGFGEATPDTAAAVLDEAARFANGVLAPLNTVGDRTPPVVQGDRVKVSPGFSEAFTQFSESGWQGLRHPEKFGGQGMPRVLATACLEMWNAANLSFALCPLLTDGAIEALLAAGSEDQQARYLPPLVAGTWAGTMNLTEPQAGSDLARVRTRAEPREDGSYRLFGTKIFITYGDHDMAENIVHLVLARLPDAPPGVKGLSLFLVPKFLLTADEAVINAEPASAMALGDGVRNDVRCVSIEHKLGIHGSPTAVLQFGDHGGAWGEMLGKPNHGLQTMFIMMNAARFGVGVQGIGLADRATQAARAYAMQRVQGQPVETPADDASKAAAPDSRAAATDTRHAAATQRTIIAHPDVRRSVATMRAMTEAARALAVFAASRGDHAEHNPDAGVRQAAQVQYDYLVPIIKGWSTEMAVEVANIGIQVHGGMGFIEETGAAQYLRDARILPIYEGTTAIQANDLVGRKTVRDEGAAAGHWLSCIDACITALHAAGGRDAGAAAAAWSSIAAQLSQARDAYAAVVEFIVNAAQTDPAAAYAGSVAYLQLAGVTLSGWQLARAALLAAGLDDGFMDGAEKSDTGRDAPLAFDVGPAFAETKRALARCFAEQVMPRTSAWRIAIVSTRGDQGIYALPDDWL
ncbi:acyl-CoA dehydrogenase [Robbsia andropogonis]|uniref:Acyl-CoA dehydrogenase n=1 Tax=Robbsia andropogonis TaxID=28092 RepID=A0A0F5JXK6_9BURK|nr:acyl-CoA dehydrogenase [Robbsia andropogonis]KKB62440.1 acyl-CoA dehydrogenase [Robbsia andropogonis]MCP1120040.1 acyl-CoA dehydrogenase [Robbsia andropogonis]MCP1129901.1 acyl-CoA dehydrogenase [Robbsia andropogonis]